MKNLKNVILIDDDFANNIICEIILKKDNFVENIKSFTDIFEGLAYLKTCFEQADMPDLLLLDINFPAENGWYFVDELDKLHKGYSNIHLPDLLILSSSINSRDIQKAKTNPLIKGFISKPLSIDKIKNILTTT